MTNKTKYFWSAVLASGVLMAATTWWYLVGSERHLVDQYLELAATYTIAFSDRAAFYLASGRPEDLSLLANTASTLLFGQVILYVQTVADGEVVVDERSAAGSRLPLALMPPPRSPLIALGRLPDGTPYVDVVNSLFPLIGQDQTPLDGYVRIGTALGQMQSDLQLARLSTGAVAVVVWGMLCLMAWLSTKWLFSAATPVGVRGRVPNVGPVVERVRTDETPTSGLRQYGELALDDERKLVVVRGAAVELSPKEFELLKLLCETPGKVYSNDEILKTIWSEHSFASAQDVKQYIYFLRRKLEADPKRPTLIVTVRGFGYRIGSIADAEASN